MVCLPSMAIQKISCGLNLHCVTDINSSLGAASEAGFQFVAAPIVHPRYYRELIHGTNQEWEGYFTRPDLTLNTQDWNTLVIGKISPWLDLDSTVNHVRKNSEKALEQELNYAAHLGLSAILLPLRNGNCVNLARSIANKVLAAAGFQGLYQVWLKLPMENPALQSQVCLKNQPEDVAIEDTWNWWNTFRTICGTEKRIGLALEISADIPSEESIKRWLGEPIRCCIIPTSIFLTNKKGFPVLSRHHQDFIRQLFKLDSQFLISGSARHQSMKFYQQYIEYLFNTKPADDAVTSYARGYEDYLQIPLQPLMDNLESCTYEVFEKDPVKYTEYQNAIYEALIDRVPESEKDSKTVVVMVVGAGRGPLVRATITAAEKSQRKIKVYAVEKNPNAIVTLFNQKEEFWHDQVTVVSCDMRDWVAPEKADILVSELLGSFGDNELSPECLDGAQKFLNEDGISIPSSYTSFLSPLQSQKLYIEVSQCRERDKPHYTCFETPYVVRLHNRTELAPSQPLFTFVHPKKDENDDNTRYHVLKFKIENNCMLHGFAGYFEAVLYKHINLSIHPETHSPGMFSWFPIFFPIKDPAFLSADSELEVHFWRCRNRRNVWYEYCIAKPFTGTIHNPNGRSYTIGL